jgi:hypothetical protein
MKIVIVVALQGQSTYWPMLWQRLPVLASWFIRFWFWHWAGIRTALGFRPFGRTAFEDLALQFGMSVEIICRRGLDAFYDALNAHQ